MVASLRLAPKLFVPYESAWALGAKLAAANALSAFEVAALMGASSTKALALTTARLPQLTRALGRELSMPAEQIELAFLAGAWKSLHPLICERLRLCPVCARLGYHFVIHQIRSFVCCPLHDVRLSDCCPHCAEHVAYDLGRSQVHGPINCPTCATPQLPVTRGGYPITGAMPAKAGTTITRWLAFLQRRSADLTLLNGVIGADNGALSGSRGELIRAIRPDRSVRNPVAALRQRWSDDPEHQGLAVSYWQQVNARWRQCCVASRRWYRRMIKGDVAQRAPTSLILAFVYWRMTWQGCTNPYLLRRGHRLPLYGVAEWEGGQPALEEDSLDFARIDFTAALTTSWNEWIDCIDLLGVTELERETWRLRARPGTYISLPRKQRNRTTNNFAELLRKIV